MVGYTPAKSRLPRICGYHPRTSLADPNRALHMWATPHHHQRRSARLGPDWLSDNGAWRRQRVLRGGSLASWISDVGKLYLRTTLMSIRVDMPLYSS